MLPAALLGVCNIAQHSASTNNKKKMVMLRVRCCRVTETVAVSLHRQAAPSRSDFSVANLMRPQIQYGLLAALRIVAALTAWGVVHPDELFQSVEVAALRCSVSCAHNLILRYVLAGFSMPITCSLGSSNRQIPVEAA